MSLDALHVVVPISLNGLAGLPSVASFHHGLRADDNVVITEPMADTGRHHKPASGMSTSWAVVVFIVAVVLIVVRVFFNMRKLRASRTESWDEKVIAQLRTQGYAPFNDYPVDFFIALPDEAAVQTVRATLEPDGYQVDVKPLENDPELNFSLHATRVMRLVVPDMQAISRKLTALAAENRGRYDGWAA